MRNTSKFIFIGLMLILGIVAVSSVSSSKVNAPNKTSTSTPTVQEFTYQGEDGKTALELLKSKYKVVTTTSSYGEFVGTINDITPDDGHFWALYVNGTLSSVGAGEYKTKSADVITWKLDVIQ